MLFGFMTNAFAWKISAGTATMNDPTVTAGFQTVSFTGAFFDVAPVVFVLAKDLETEPRALRIQNVTTTGFEIIQVRPTVCGGCADAGNFSTPTISWIAIEPGRHLLPGGQPIEVGSTSTTTVQKKFGGAEGWDTIPFSTLFSTGSIAMVGQVQTNNNGVSLTGGQTNPFITTAIRNANATNFQTALQLSEVVTAIPIPNAETIGWLAAPNGLTDTLTDTGSASVLIEAILSADNITHTCSIDNNFSNTYSSNPLVVSSMNRLDGGDGGWMRECQISTSAVRLRVQEDEGTDNDVGHTTESAGLFVVERAFDAEVVIENPTMEVVEVTLNDTTVTPTFTSVTFQQTFTTTPLVFILPTNEGGTTPASIRIRNVTTTGFEVAQVEPDSFDGPHSAMTVHYMAIQPGSGVSPWAFAFPDGRLLEIGTHATQTVQHGSGVAGTEGWDTVNFSSSFTAPAVLTAIQGMANESANPPVTTSVPWITVAMQNVGGTSFQVALERAEVASGSVSTNETIAYFAIDGDIQGSFASGAATILYESITSADNITGWDNNNCAGNVGTAVGFVNGYGIAPLVMGNQSRHDGGDGGWLRRCSLTAAQIGLTIDEDQFANAERSHTTEAANLLAFSEAFCLPANCPGLTVDHYAINFPNGLTSLTCEAANVVITGHDLFNSAINIPAGVVITLSTSTGTGTWQPALISGTGTWVPSGLNDGNATYTWPGGESSFEVSLLQGAAGTLSVNLIDALGKTESTVIASEDLSITFNTRGLRFTVNGTSASSIDTQISGKNNNQAPGQTIDLQIVRTTGGSTCSPPPGGGVTTRTVQFAAECINPSVCELGSGGPGFAVSVEDNTPTFIPIGVNDFSGGSPTNYVNVNMDFSNVTGLSVNPFVFNYPDAGEIVIHATMTIGPFTLPGASNKFVVRPFGFDVQVPTGNPPHATGPGGNTFTDAGSPFTVTTRAVQWQLADDSDNDGVPDRHESGDIDPSNNADLSDNGVTPNYGQEALATEADVTLSSLLDQPSGGNDPGLSVGTSINTFTSGSGSTTTAQFDEVGILEVRAGLADSDYLGVGQIQGVSGYVGRFTPYVFDVTSNTPVIDSACGTFSYVGQPFMYSTAPTLTVTPHALGASPPTLGSVIQNYTGGFFKMTQASLTIPGGTDKGYSALTGTLDLGLVPAKPTVTDNLDGTATLLFSDGGGFSFSRAAPVVNFDAEIGLQINVIDTDTKFNGDGAGTDLNPEIITPATAGNGVSFNTTKDQRWGRLVIGSGAGSELLPINLTMRTEYYNGTDFDPNNLDSCTDIIPASELSLSNSVEVGQTDGNIIVNNSCGGSAVSTVTAVSSTFSSGVNTYIFSNPDYPPAGVDAGCTGYIDVTTDLSVGSGKEFWLQYDWSDDGLNDEDPTGRVDFGLYEGPKSFIYIREPW